MISWLKKHFIPHEGNDHQPHFLRSENIRFIVLIVFAIELGVFALPFISVLNPANNNYIATVLPAVLDDLSNQNRQSQHLAVLTVNPLLNKVAELKAKDMAEKSYFAHVSPDGKAPWYWFNLVGYKYEYAGENLAVDFTDSQDVTSAWMNSPTHRANIIKNVYTEIGTGVASGMFEGRPTVFVAQVYGKPMKPVVTSEPTKVVKSTPTTSVPAVEASTSKVLGASSEVALTEESNSNIFDKYITSPRHVANLAFIILGALVALALLFKLFIRMDKKHPVLITNGLIVLVFIFGVYSVNNYMAGSKIATNVSFASFHGEEFDSAK
ncbi:MAG: CAP domain-containing protein [Minisyncoccota bacterium]